VIEHLDDDVNILRRLWTQLRPGGHLIVTVPAHQCLWSYFDEVAHHRRRYAPAELERKLAAAGFTVFHVTQFMAALFPLMWVKRRLLGERASKLSQAASPRQQAAAESDLEIFPPLNWLLEIAHRPEAFFIARRIRLPLGSSLLAIATRPGNDSHPSHRA